MNTVHPPSLMELSAASLTQSFSGAVSYMEIQNPRSAVGVSTSYLELLEKAEEILSFFGGGVVG